MIVDIVKYRAKLLEQKGRASSTQYRKGLEYSLAQLDNVVVDSFTEQSTLVNRICSNIKEAFYFLTMNGHFVRWRQLKFFDDIVPSLLRECLNGTQK